jgi:MauM/NapG family ferredoxin protein
MVGTVLAFEQPVFRQMILMALIFSGILALNLLAPRFWCRYLCPLGAMLGLLGTKQFMARVDVNSDRCVKCGTCNRTCQGDATPFPPGEWASRECIACWNCQDVCPCTAVSIHPTLKKTGDGNVDLERRWFLSAGAAAVLSVPIVTLGEQRKRINPELIRPPGALPETEFVKTCVKCGECMKVCLTNGLQPTLHQAGLEGIWTPILVPKLGYCEYYCTLCGQVCPTGAIKHLELAKKQTTKIGMATFDKNRCIPYTYNRNCGVCEEHCPARGKAIRFNEEESFDRKGNPFILKKPYVVPQICIGCGICENKCPVVDIPAIRVSPINESRGDARIFL